ncbi:MAG: glycosyltransferase [Deltaproteobacteria bacterium]|nr:glycosyltransferase [Deltaproteobacteria bacterium]
MTGELRIGFLGTFPPRRCGIATFTRALSDAVRGADARVSAMTLAMTDSGGQYEYSQEVEYEIRQGVKGDYARAAELVNFSDVRVVSIQHEHGIFGGDDGAYVLDFLGALRVPAVVTLHTVLKRPSESQKRVIQGMAAGSAAVVVMSRVAHELLANSYGVSGPRVAVIPHGIHEMKPRDANKLKAKFGVAGRPMLLTFGLLSPNKGVETMIRALPALVSELPNLAYFVVGATHPTVVRQHGEAYRSMLEREAERLGVREHVVFRDQFVTNDELASYLQAADVFVSPYLNEAQVTSGALSCAMGAGAAVVSTPYWHAQELLADGRGCLFPFGDSAALAKAIASLLGDREMLDRVRSSAYEYTRPMLWPHVGRRYVDLATRAIEAAPVRALRARPPRASSLPELRLDHLLRLTDDTGIIQHATYTVPARLSGYCVDDNARAMVVALAVDRVSPSPQAKRLVTKYLSFLQGTQALDGHFVNLMGYDRTLEPLSTSDDCLGRAVWALGTCVDLAVDVGCRMLAREMLFRALPRTLSLGPRGTALTILGLARLMRAEPGAADVLATLGSLADKLVARYREQATDDWHWFEPTLTYDNAMIPLALFQAYGVTGDRASLRVARESLEFLESVSFAGPCMSLVGNAGWLRRGGEKSAADEQAIDATAFVLAFRAAYVVTHDHQYLARMRQSFAWFLGTNRLGIPLYDSDSGGCRDGLGATAPNHNQGAESTICFLLSLLEMLELAGEGLEHAAAVETAGRS